ncbi:hypothetical protein ACFQL1_17675 [Halomicroarcula sp. GCM10025709]|uniref:hypothetical protein n=1 Tax=Halomicroarcula sp. GCM10025709 TaxID=3252669 RepID=UPI0036073E1F
MRSLELTVDDETARSLAVEAELLDFDDVERYLGWLVANRFAIEDDSQRGAASVPTRADGTMSTPTAMSRPSPAPPPGRTV